MAAFLARMRACLGFVLVLGLAGQALVPAGAAEVPIAKRFVAPEDSRAAPLELRDLSGKVHRLSDYRGRVVLVNFWATWCEPCRDEMPSLQTLKRHMDAVRKDAFVVLAVNHAENEASIARFLKTQTVDFPVLLDPFSVAWQAWKPGLLPASFLIGADGRLRYRVLGELDWAHPDAEALVRRLLAEAAS
jgi:thiol-disulfide isomerase/thioredoxin